MQHSLPLPVDLFSSPGSSNMNFCCSFNPFSLSKSAPTTPQTIISNANFVAINLSIFKNYQKSSQERMKEFQILCHHPPSITERINLRIPSIYEVINVTNIHGMILLCGGNNNVQIAVEVQYSMPSLLSPFLSLTPSFLSFLLCDLIRK